MALSREFLEYGQFAATYLRRTIPAPKTREISFPKSWPLKVEEIAARGCRHRYVIKRGTAEQWIKEGKQAVKMTRLSCHRFRFNKVRLGLSVIAYNLGNLSRRLVLPKRIDQWSLTTL